MINFLPIIQLKSVIFPTENVNLHLSGSGDVQLIKDCLKAQKPFGITFSIDHRSAEIYGTLTEIAQLKNELEDGSLQVCLKGIRVFRLLEMKNEIPDKKYKGAVVEYPPEEAVKVAPETERLIISEVKRLYRLLYLEERFAQKQGNFSAFEIAHKLGMDARQEYELLTTFSEVQRMEYIRRYLSKMMPVVSKLEEIKKRILMNGHFRDLS